MRTEMPEMSDPTAYAAQLAEWLAFRHRWPRHVRERVRARLRALWCEEA